MKTLFDKTQIKGMSLKNRFIRAAVGDPADGYINKNILDLYDKLAKGGAGTLITGYTLIDEAEKQFPQMLAFYDDSFTAGHKELVDLAHSYNANIILQLVYIGSYSSEVLHDRVKNLIDKSKILAPSAVQNINTGNIAKEASIDDLKNIQQKFAQAALRAKNTGYDGIEIHAAHGFFLSQFMSHYYNRRKDNYGGSVQNMARMSIETYEAIRKAVGADYPVFIKVNVKDDEQIKLSFDDVLYLCGQLSQKGIDAIEISGSFRKFSQESTSFFKEEAEKIAKQNETAVILTGGNRNFNEMTSILNSSEIEYFGMARSLIADPDLINKFAKE
ncbi:MAG: NADH:flavin oxidoreductase [Elusimicrobiota bacterium]|jgi:2,4-dienoyl-CoA reductase-like NADH-dependent reductase (Old Yellow Enzyme family)|nr:NADH:flavin oxidoreductase [Elusimicrobiota bacterium]